MSDEEFLDLKENYEKKKKHSDKKEEKTLERLNAAQEEIEDLKNAYAKVFADSQNLRKELEKEQKEIIKYRAVGFIDGLLPILDNFHFAFLHPAPNQESANYRIGFEMIYKNLKQLMQDEGVEEIFPQENEEFDPNLMEAVETQTDETKEDGVILNTVLPGYKFKDRLLRPASVVVNQKEKEKTAK